MVFLCVRSFKLIGLLAFFKKYLGDAVGRGGWGGWGGEGKVINL
jgi:hypothetical protein